MASGPEHYRAAEDLIAQAAHDMTSGRAAAANLTITAAQVHATLALAAAAAYDHQAKPKGGQHAPRH